MAVEADVTLKTFVFVVEIEFSIDDVGICIFGEVGDVILDFSLSTSATR